MSANYGPRGRAVAPAVSVITIFLNAASFIDEAIRSVLAQTHGDWELLLVDDGSADASTDIALAYAAAHPERIRYLEHEGHANHGMSASRNLGIRHARGRYIGFLDSDDVWEPRRLEHHVAILDAHTAASMVYGPTLYWYGWTGRSDDAARDFIGELWTEPGRVVQPPRLLRLFLETGGGALPGICSLLARRDAVHRIGGFESSFRGTYEDQVFLAKICLNEPVYVTGECLDRYRQHLDSCCQQAIATGEYDPDRPHPARARYLDWLEAYLNEQHVRDPAILRALERELRPYRHPWLFRVVSWTRAVTRKD